RPDLVFHTPGAERQRALVGRGCVLDAKGDGADRRSVYPGKTLSEAFRFAVDDEIHVTLAEQRNVLGAVFRHLHEAHALQQQAERRRIGRSVLDELEAVGPHRIVHVHVDLPNVIVSNVTIMLATRQVLELENFLPYRLSILAQLVSESLHDLYVG